VKSSLVEHVEGVDVDAELFDAPSEAENEYRFSVQSCDNPRRGGGGGGLLPDHVAVAVVGCFVKSAAE
jgi:hypothetical protein